ncbi:DUF1467 family protein [Rhodoligotrophos defluvii]|uniref:DUF1467 family protein n=1 Tax=Rhodoligotrophos defluvii TaxID=2561934 RepID=UPI0010C96F3E|nr:DUF1467 family protein [Rhodoligotrophos defluvii]
MSLTSSLAIYFILWWVVLFAVLPFGNYSPHELDETPGPGEAPSAPKDPRLGRKFVITTVVSGAIFALVYTLFSAGVIALDNLPFFDVLKPYS